MGALFGLTSDESLQVIRQNKDFNGATHIKYQQSYKGIPIWGRQVIVSRDGSSNVYRINGSLVQQISQDITSIPSSLNPKAAMVKMQQALSAKDTAEVWNFKNEKYGTYIYLDKNNKANLCYVVSYFADQPKSGKPTRPVYFIDVKTGKVIDQYENLQHAYDGTGPGGNTKVGQYEYGTNYTAFGVTISGTTYTMNYANCKTVDMNHTTSGTTPFSYTGPRNTHETVNGGYCPLNDAQFFGQQIYDMYNNWYGLAVLPFQLTMKVHYRTNYENAFWDGSSMTFGDGYTTFYPLVCLDVSAHEVSHGFTENHSDLTYSGQSGGINESFSDMAGEAAKFYMRGTNDFKVGYDIFKSSTGALRYMYNPPLDGYSIDNVSEYTTSTDVHYSSGIFNKAFYLIATSTGWTTRMAFDIFVKANTDYWTTSTTFVQGAQGALDAAADYGYNCADVVTAFANVGITLTCPAAPVANFTGTPTSGAAPLTVAFTDSSTNTPTSWSWNFGDGGTSTLKNPSHTYTTQGTYSVTLTATNANGSNSYTRSNYITVSAPAAPVAAFTATPTSTSINTNVTFTDQSTNTPTSWSWNFGDGTTSTLQNPTHAYTTAGTYSVSLTATNAQGSNTLTKSNYITVSSVSYCTSASTDYSDEYIKTVKFGTTSNTSVGSYYTDYTSVVFNLTRGTSVSFTLTPGFTGTSYTEYWKVWIDYNKDGDFADTGEQIYSGSGKTAKTSSFTVSSTASTGATRMRVTMKYGSTPTYCGSFTYGEVEDYTANIQ